MTARRVLPQAVEAEEYVVAALLRAGADGGTQTYERVRATGLVAADFFRDRNGRVFTAIERVVARGAAPHPELVLADMRVAGEASADAEAYLKALAARADVAVSNVAHIAGLVVQAARDRERVRAAEKAADEVLNGGLSDAARERLLAAFGTTTGETDTTWLASAADLLAEPDPGPTPWLVEGLIVAGAIAAVQGPAKVGKTWVVLEIAVSVVAGRPAFGRYEVPEPGPVIAVLEESGRAALHRRLDMLVRGRALDPAVLAELRFAANARVRLDEPLWRERLLGAARMIRPRAVILDPFVRVKGATVDENIQREVGPVLDFLRDLRDASGAAVVFVHHTGHEGSRLRGSSDLEAYWESKLAVTGEGTTATVAAEHREAPETETFRFRRSWDETTRTLRLNPVEPDAEGPSLADLIAAFVQEHGDPTTNQVVRNVTGRDKDVTAVLQSDPRFEQAPKRASDQSKTVRWRFLPSVGRNREQPVAPPLSPGSSPTVPLFRRKSRSGGTRDGG